MDGVGDGRHESYTATPLKKCHWKRIKYGINDCFHIKKPLSRTEDVSTIPLGVCYGCCIVNII